MESFKKNVDKKTQKIEKEKIGKNGQALMQQQEATGQLQAIQGEQRANLMTERQAQMADMQNLDTIGQAAELGASTTGILGKYGYPAKNPPRKVVQSRQVSVAPNKITINNNTTNNIQNGGGSQQGNDSPGKFKAWLTRVLTSQKESARRRNFEYEKRESYLAKTANRMLKRIESAGRSVADTLNPQNLGMTIGNQFKILLMLFGMRFLSKYWGKIVPVLVKGVNFIADTAAYFGIGRKSGQGFLKGSGFYNDMIRFLGGQPGVKGKSSLLDVGRTWIKELTDFLTLKFDHMMTLRGEAIKSIKMPTLDFGNIGATVGSIAQYLGNILTAMVDPKSAMHQSLRSNVNTVGLSQSMKHSESWRGRTFGNDTDAGDGSLVMTVGGKRNYSLDKKYISATGGLTSGPQAQISQSLDILGAVRSAKETGQIDTARFAAGLQRLQDASNTGLVTVDPEFIDQVFNSSTRNNLMKGKHIQRKLYKYVRVKKTQADFDENGEYGFAGGAARQYAGRVAGEKLVGGIGGKILGDAATGGPMTGKILGEAMINPALAALDYTDIGSSLHAGVNGAVKKAFANNYTYKLVPAEDNSYGGAAANPSNGRPWFVNMYTLDKEALTKLGQSYGGKEGIDSSDQNFLRGIEQKLINAGGGSAATEKRWSKNKKKGEEYKTLDIARSVEDINRFDNTAAAFEAEEKALYEKSSFGKTVENSKVLGNRVIDGAQDMINSVIEWAQDGAGFSIPRAGDGSWKGATLYGHPTKAVPGTTFNVKLASRVITQNASKRLFDANGTPLNPPQPKSATTSTHRCATYVRIAIAAGLGMKELRYRPGSAKDYVSYLGGYGFQAIPWTNYSPKQGDVIVLAPLTDHPHGHIAIKADSAWISDFVQKDMWGGSAYRNSKCGTVFRHIKQSNNGIDQTTEDIDTFDTSMLGDYKEVLYDAGGNIVGYKTEDGTMVDTKGNEMTQEMQSTVANSASFSGFQQSQEWSGGDVSGYLVGKKAQDVAAPIIDYLMKNNGLTKEQAAGVVGNLYAESGLGTGNYRLDRTITDSNGKPSGGLAMWNGANLLRLQKFAADRGKSWGDFQTQIEFLSEELKTMKMGDMSGTMGDMLKSANSAGDAARLFGRYYERFAGYKDFGGKEHTKRAGYATNFAGGQVVDYNTSSIMQEGAKYSQSSSSAIALTSQGLKDGIGGKKVAVVGDSWMCLMLGLKTANVTSKDRRGSYAQANSNNPIFKELKKAGASDCVGFARVGAAVGDMVPYVTEVLSQRPDVIVVHAGLNNGMDTYENLVAQYRRVQGAAGGVPIFFCSINNVGVFANLKHPFDKSPLAPHIADKMNSALQASGVNILDIRHSSFECREANGDGLHPPMSMIPALSATVVNKLVAGAKDYKGNLMAANSGIYGETTNNEFDKDPISFYDDATGKFKVDLSKFKFKTGEGSTEYNSKLQAARLWQNTNIGQEMGDIAGQYQKFEEWFSKLSGKDQSNYTAKKHAEKVWNDILDKDAREGKDFKELFPRGETDFIKAYINTPANKRQEFLDAVVNMAGYQKAVFDRVKRYSIESEKNNAGRADEREELFRLGKFVDTDNDNLYSKYGMASKGWDIFKWGGNSKINENSWGKSWSSYFGGSLVDNDADQREVYSLLASGNIEAARKLAEESKWRGLGNYGNIRDLNDTEGDKYKEQMGEMWDFNFGLLNSRVQASEQYQKLESEIKKLTEQYETINDDDSIQSKNAKMYVGLQAEKNKYVQSHLADDFLNIDDTDTAETKLAKFKSNKKLAELNAKFNAARYYYDPDDPENKKNKFKYVDEKGNELEGTGISSRFAEEFYAQERSKGYYEKEIKDENGNVIRKDRIYSGNAMKPYMDKLAQEKMEEYNKLRLDREQFLKKRLLGEEEAKKWREEVEKTMKSMDDPKGLNYTIDETIKAILAEKKQTGAREDSDVWKSARAEALKRLVDEGKLSADGYITKMGWIATDRNHNAFTTADNLKDVGESWITTDRKGNKIVKYQHKDEKTGKLITKSKAWKDASSEDIADAMSRDVNVGVSMSAEEYNRLVNLKAVNKEDFIKRTPINQYNPGSVGYYQSGNNYTETFDEKAYEKAVKKYNEDKKKLNGSKARHFKENRLELMKKLNAEELENLERTGQSWLAGEDGIKRRARVRAISRNLSEEQYTDESKFENYLKGIDFGGKISETDKGIMMQNIKKANGNIIEQKVTLGDGTVVTKLLDSDGNLLQLVVPEDVKEKREKSMSKIYRELGFNTEMAKKRQDELDAATEAWRHEQELLAAKGVTAQEALNAQQMNTFRQLSEIYNLALGGNEGIRVTINGPNLNPPSIIKDDTDNNKNTLMRNTPWNDQSKKN